MLHRTVIIIKHIARRRNDEEDAKEELYSLVTVTEVPPEGINGLGTKVIEGDD